MVCVPGEAAKGLTEFLSDQAEVEVIVWDGQGQPPDRMEEIQFWVPPFGWNVIEELPGILSAMPALEVIQVTSAGYDQFEGRLPPHVRLCNGRGIHGGSTSEWVLAVTLASLREIPRFVRAADDRRWDYHSTDELAGKRVLIIGAGDLGQQTARRLRAFDAEPVLVARTARDDIHALSELPELLPSADVVVLVVPKTDETTGLVNAEFLARLRDGALVVNAARGPVVDTAALLAELQSGRLHAALDVTDPEPLPTDHPLWSAPNLLITPHVGGSVFGYAARARRLVAEQIARFATGEELINVVIDGD
ncbi:MAG: D-isomer specific 2-hydroxyacid dehydrogenase NAD-binding [Pseudonocardiales bacterium]|nr:D-isomer specific 2-hydroxyacid dehydrogenase NAD-binding [Pseudonocardiales bacterium]